MRNYLPPSTRAQTKATGVFTRSSSGSHSLERGLSLIRAFLGGTVELTNAELAARSGLPRSTVSRLTRSLVEANFLEYDALLSVYRLAPVCASLGAAYGQGHSWWPSARQLLGDVARHHQLNIGLSVRDGLHFVYLEAERAAPGPVQRVVRSGSRAPIEAFASGHALISLLSDAERHTLFQQLAAAHPAQWPSMRQRIERSLRQCRRQGFCKLPSVPGLTSLAAPVVAPDGTRCAAMVSVQDNGQHDLTQGLPQVLRDTVRGLQALWADTHAVRLAGSDSKSA